MFSVSIIFFLTIMLSLPLTKYSKLPLLFPICLLIFAFGFRADFGNDYSSYHDLYSQYTSTNSWIGYEALFYRVLSAFHSFKLFVLAHTVLLCILIYIFIRTAGAGLSKPVFLAFLLLNPYIFLMHLSAMRQAIAIMLIAIAINTLFMAKSRIKSLILIFFATQFHLSALFGLLVYPAYLTRPWRVESVLLLGSLISGIVVLNLDSLLRNAAAIEPSLSVYSSYLNVDFTGSALGLLSSILIAILVIYIASESANVPHYVRSICVITMIASVHTFSVPYLARLVMYGEVFIPVLAALAFNSTRKLRKLILLLLIAYFVRYVRFFHSELYGPHYSHLGWSLP